MYTPKKKYYPWTNFCAITIFTDWNLLEDWKSRWTFEFNRQTMSPVSYMYGNMLQIRRVSMEMPNVLVRFSSVMRSLSHFPYTPLRHVGEFSCFRVVSRYFYYFMLCLCMSHRFVKWTGVLFVCVFCAFYHSSRHKKTVFHIDVQTMCIFHSYEK